MLKKDIKEKEEKAKEANKRVEEINKHKKILL